jgi:hypothetical protein
MLESRGDPDLAMEPLGAQARTDVRVEDLDGDGAIVAEIVGAIDRCHPTLADGLPNLVAGKGEGGGHAANRRMMSPAGSTLWMPDTLRPACQ